MNRPTLLLTLALAFLAGLAPAGEKILISNQSNDSAELAGMEGELEALGDADGMAAVAGRREAMGQEIAGIEDNLSEVRAALCQQPQREAKGTVVINVGVINILAINILEFIDSFFNRCPAGGDSGKNLMQ